MKKISHRQMYFLLVCCMTAFCALLTSCKNDTIGSPVITAVRNYVASPNDTIINSAVAKGQWVVIEGKYLQDALQISFDGVPATFNNALFSSDHAVVQIPSILFSTIDVNKLYTIEYKTTTGTASFSFKLGPEAPTITAISDVFANPGDSVFLYGTNLVLVENLTYGGAKISSYKSNLDGTSLGFVMPSPAPTSGKVLLTTKSGATSFDILALPTITGVSNENANPGDSVYVYGTYLKGIQTFTFGGDAITSYKLSAKGNSIGFVLPSSVHSGPVSVTTVFGTASTVYNVNDTSTGILSNLQGGNGWQWWGGANLYSGDPKSGWPGYIADFPGNSSHFLVLKTNTLIPDEGNTWSNYAIRLVANQWVPSSNLNDPISNWALKFEVSIPKPWNGGTIDIQSSLGTYISRYEPWQISSNTTAAYSTKGWITVTIPFSSFRAKDATLGDGKGAPMVTFTDLLGPSGNSECLLYIHNYSSSNTSTGFYGAFDNFRVVKIK